MNFRHLLHRIMGKLGGIFATDIGIDLGTANTLVYVRGDGIVLCEPSVVAVSKDTHEVLKVGAEAKDMLGRTPGNIMAIRPLKEGVIADFDATEAMLRRFIEKANPRKYLASPRVVVAIPSGITEVEKRAVKESAQRAGAREVFLIEEPMAAAIGVGLPIADPSGNMIIDIGGGTTEIAVISLSGIVYSTSIKMGGDKWDVAILEHVKKTYNLLIGERTAEMIKIKIGSAYPVDKETTLDIRGRDMVTGLPKTVTISSEEIREALKDHVHKIIDAVRLALEKTPPELSADLIDKGIVLAGGGALLKGIDRLIAEETGLPVIIADDPITAVAVGTGKVLEEEEFLWRVTVPVRYE